MQLQQVRQLSQSELKQIVNLHSKVLSDSNLNKFGRIFLKLIYNTSARDKECLLLILKDNDNVVGFALTSRNSHYFYRQIIAQNRLKAYTLMVLGFLKNPALFLETVKWLFQKDDSIYSAELIFLAIDPNYQRQGWGQKLVKETINILRKEKIQFLVKTGFDVKQSNNFYKKNKFEYLYQKKVMGKNFNFYLSPKLK